MMVIYLFYVSVLRAIIMRHIVDLLLCFLFAGKMLSKQQVVSDRTAL